MLVTKGSLMCHGWKRRAEMLMFLRRADINCAPAPFSHDGHKSVCGPFILKNTFYGYEPDIGHKVREPASKNGH